MNITSKSRILMSLLSVYSSIIFLELDVFSRLEIHVVKIVVQADRLRYKFLFASKALTRMSFAYLSNGKRNFFFRQKRKENFSFKNLLPRGKTPNKILCQPTVSVYSARLHKRATSYKSSCSEKSSTIAKK